MKKKKTKIIDVNYLARVEGEGALYVEIEEDKIKDVKLKIFEPPRFFEALLRGRDLREAPDFTARICGICPIAYQMSSVNAMENALKISVEGQLNELRRLVYCGEWIESHGLHIMLLHAPDFLGFPDAIEMAKTHPDAVKRGLRIKKAGNSIVSFLGGREIHPINVKVGGFYKVPEKKELVKLTDELKWARDASLETVRWVSGFDFPQYEIDYEFVALTHPDRYPLNEGVVKSNKGLSMNPHQFNDFIEEYQVEYSNALQARVKGRGSYITGPMARYALNFQNLPPLVKEAAKDIGFPEVCRNPFQSIIVRSLEVVYAFDEALRIIQQYEKPEEPAVPYELRAATGFGWSEAPRGLLFHRYEVDENGLIKTAQIVPPTSQNQTMMEEDLREYLKDHLDRSESELTQNCERLIRNHDPCISCSAHFLNLQLKRS